MEGSLFCRTLHLDERASQDTLRLVWPRPPVREKLVGKKARLWIQWRLSLKGRSEVCASHIYPILLYWFSVLPLSSTELILLVQVLLNFLWGGRWPVCCHHPSEGSLGMPDVEIRQQTLRFKFLDQMCQQDEGNGLFWKEDAKKAFPALRSVHEGEGRPAVLLGPSAPILSVDSL